jgi:hypothetical protein
MRSEPLESYNARRERYRAAGICTKGRRHGPAVKYDLCEPCATAYLATQRKLYERRKVSGFCTSSASHGRATHGRLCDVCFAKRSAEDRARPPRVRRAKPTCAFGASHGPAVDGAWCKECVARRTRAAARIAARNTPAKQPVPPKTQPERHKETVRERIERGGNFDSGNVWEALWHRM